MPRKKAEETTPDTVLETPEKNDETPVAVSDTVNDGPLDNAPTQSFNPFLPITGELTAERVEKVFKEGTPVYVANGPEETLGKSGTVMSVVEERDRETRELKGIAIMVRFRILGSEHNAQRPMPVANLMIVGDPRDYGFDHHGQVTV